MSCTKISENTDEPEDGEAEDTLVVVVKPDGTVAIDQETFNRVMENKKETMNIIHFENSSNQGITTNPENGEPEINLTVQGFYPSISTKTFFSEDILSREKIDVSKNTIYLDHCYYKNCPPNSSESYKNSISLDELTETQIINENEDIEEITVLATEDALNSSPYVLIEDIHSDIPKTSLPHLSNTKNVLKSMKNEKSKPKGPVLKNTTTKKKLDEVPSNQSNDIPKVLKTLKRLIPTKSNQVRPTRQKKADVIDQVLLQANELVRQSSIEPKKYIQNQLLLKKNKDKIGNNENSMESLSPEKQVNNLLEGLELFSSSDIVIDDNKTITNVENINLNSETNIIEKVDGPRTRKGTISDVSKDVIVDKGGSFRIRKISNRIKESPVDTTVAKTVEDILNDISSRIANQTDIIDEENLIDELADLNEDLNSSNFVAPSNSSHDLMNKLLSDDNLNQSDKKNIKTPGTDEKTKCNAVIYGKSGKVVTLPPIETPKTRSLVKKEIAADTSMKDENRQRRSSENSKFNDYSEESDTDKEGTMSSEDDPNRLWCICKKPHNNRFMICCDTCEEWFHGKCVGVTKVLGQQMETRGVEWNCPPCRKKKIDEARKRAEEEKNKKKLEEEMKKKVNLKSPAKKIDSTVTKTDLKSPAKKNDSTTTKTPPQSQTNCIQCKSALESVAMGLFCGEKCLEKHIEDSLTAIKTCCTTESPDIILFDKKNSRLITGEQAPKLGNLKQWMKENPAFQILKPAGFTKPNLNKPSSKSQNNTKLSQSTLKFVRKDTENRLKRPATGPDKHKTKELKKEFNASDLMQPDKMQLITPKKDIQKSILPQKETFSKHTTPKESSKSVQLVTHLKPSTSLSKGTDVQKCVRKKSEIIKPPEPVIKKIEPIIKKAEPIFIKKTEPIKKPELIKRSEPVKDTLSEKKGDEQLRSNVKKSLLESLSNRISEKPELKTAEENLEELIIKIEEELFNQFGKVDQKYKTKYRSLLFNIKDPKNLNFFKKIMFKWVTPQQLVRMTADEMASQELAEWRERENKHQIEMIRKTELDMMNQSTALLLKTHKGEEIIESRINKETIISELNPDIKIEEKKPQIVLQLPKEDKKDKKRNKYKEKSIHIDRERRYHKSSRNHHKSHKDRKRRSRDRSKSKDKKDKKVEKNKKIETEIGHITNAPEVLKEDISDREPSSTVVIATPPRVEEEISPIWKGTINFSDVARCDVSMSRLSGNIAGLESELSLMVLECVGRIKQQTVWEYMGKLKKTGTKDIIVTKLSASNMEQQMSYLSLYQYLSAKTRIAVIDSKPFPNIKDFYIYPLGNQSPVPQVLLPLDGPGVDDHRTHLLLGIIVRNSKKQWVPPYNCALPDMNDIFALPHLKPALPTSSQDSYSPKESYTPPRSPTNKILSLPTPVLPLVSVINDDDLPYVPGEEEPYSPVDEDLPSLSDDIPNIREKMVELNRRIAKEKMEIQSLVSAGVSHPKIGDINPLDSNDEVYSPSNELDPLTADIQLPSNIKDILSSINTKEQQPIEAEVSKAVTDTEKKCRDPRQRNSSTVTVEPPPPGLEDEFSSTCNPDTSLPPPNFPNQYMPPLNYIPSVSYSYPPPGYMSETYSNQFGPQQPPPPPPPPPMVDQSNYNNYNQSGYAYNSVYQPPLPPPYRQKSKKGKGFWVSGNSMNEPKKKKFKKSGDRRDNNKGSWRRHV